MICSMILRVFVSYSLTSFFGWDTIRKIFEKFYQMEVFYGTKSDSFSG